MPQPATDNGGYNTLHVSDDTLRDFLNHQAQQGVRVVDANNNPIQVPTAPATNSAPAAGGGMAAPGMNAATVDGSATVSPSPAGNNPNDHKRKIDFTAAYNNAGNDQRPNKIHSKERIERDNFRNTISDLIRSSHGVNGLTMQIINKIVDQVMAQLAAEFAPPAPPSDNSDLDH